MSVRAVPLVVGTQVFKLVISLALQIVIARFLMPEERGVYAICLAISMVLLVVTYFGNEFGIRYLLVRKRITSAQAFRYLLLTVLISLTIALGLASIGTFLDIWPLDRVTWLQLALACLFSFSQLITTQINVFLTLRSQYLEASVLAIMEEVVKLIAMVAFLYFTLPMVEIALLAVIFGNVTVSLFSVFRYKLHLNDFGEIRKRDIRYIYGYGLRSVWLNLSSLSNMHMGTLILSGLMSNGQVGIYNLAFGLIARIQVLPDALNRVLVPVSMASKDEDRRFRMVQVSVTGLLAVSLLVVPVLGLFSEPIMTLLFGIEYVQAGPIAFILFLGFVFKVVGKPLEAHFNEISGNPTVIAGIQVFSITVMVLLTYFGAAKFGVTGAAIGSSVALSLGSIALFIVYARSTGRSLSDLVSLGALISRLKQLRQGRR